MVRVGVGVEGVCVAGAAGGVGVLDCVEEREGTGVGSEGEVG